MSADELGRAAALIRAERDHLLASWRAQVRLLPSARHLDTPTLNNDVPVLLDELVAAFENDSGETIPDAILEGSPAAHGFQRHQHGYDIVEVVAEYNILRGCIHDLTESRGIHLRGRAFHVLNRVLDESISLAVQSFATQKALEVQKRREEYLAFVAHDLRTPLNAIALAATVLERELAGWATTPKTTQMMRALRRNVEHLAALVENVLKESAHVRTETGVKLEQRKLDLWPLVEALIHDLRPVAGTASTELINTIPEELTAYADASLLRRIFQNLIANAIKYTPRGRVLIGARAAEPSGTVECWVRDNGAGIPGDRLAAIFDKLESDPQRDDGTGLGLAIVKTFVEAHGGHITVDSREGAGSVFRFTLPGRPEPASSGS